MIRAAPLPHFHGRFIRPLYFADIADIATFRLLLVSTPFR